MNRQRRERRWQSPKDRARVAAELIEEAESLSATGLIATPADLVQATRPPPIRVPEKFAAPEPAAKPPPPAAGPDNSEPLTAVGLTLLRRGLWAEAATQLQRAVATDPGRPSAWYYLGEALNHLDDLSGALAAFTRAAELEPANAKAYHGQGIVLDRLNRPEDATRMYRRARDVTRR